MGAETHPSKAITSAPAAIDAKPRHPGPLGATTVVDTMAPGSGLQMGGLKHNPHPRWRGEIQNAFFYIFYFAVFFWIVTIKNALPLSETQAKALKKIDFLKTSHFLKLNFTPCMTSPISKWTMVSSTWHCGLIVSHLRSKFCKHPRGGITGGGFKRQFAFWFWFQYFLIDELQASPLLTSFWVQLFIKLDWLPVLPGRQSHIVSTIVLYDRSTFGDRWNTHGYVCWYSHPQNTAERFTKREGFKCEGVCLPNLNPNL